MYEELSHVGMTNCWLCGKGAEIVLDTRLRATLKRNMGSRPDIICSECETPAKENNGIWLISIANGENPPSDKKEIWNPYRTGKVVLIKKSALKRMFTAALNPDVLENTLNLVDNNIYFYMNDEVWDMFGLPHPESSEAGSS